MEITTSCGKQPPTVDGGELLAKINALLGQLNPLLAALDTQIGEGSLSEEDSAAMTETLGWIESIIYGQ